MDLIEIRKLRNVLYTFLTGLHANPRLYSPYVASSRYRELYKFAASLVNDPNFSIFIPELYWESIETDYSNFYISILNSGNELLAYLDSIESNINHSQSGTPDDFAQLNPCFLTDDDKDYERELSPQARPNVIFEAGMALGRCEDRTILVNFGTLRPFSDVSGRHCVNFDGSASSRNELVNILQTVGVNANTAGKSDWLMVGNFSIDHEINYKELNSYKAVDNEYSHILEEVIKAIYRNGDNGGRSVTLQELQEKEGFAKEDIFIGVVEAEKRGFLKNVPVSGALYNWLLTLNGNLYVEALLEKNQNK
jgi:hypothetical protein